MTTSGGKFLIGNVGRTGTATGPNIHTFIKDRKTGALLDPDTIKTPFIGVQIGEKRTPLVRRNAAGGLEWNPEAGLTITSRFGKRGAPTAGASTYHQGMDFAGAAGTPVYYQGYGKALPIPAAGGYGNLMTFKTADDKYELGFGHMSKLGPEAQVYASNFNAKPAAPVLPASDFAVFNQGQVQGAGSALNFLSNYLGRSEKKASPYSGLISSLLQQQRDPTEEFLMSYVMGSNPNAAM